MLTIHKYCPLPEKLDDDIIDCCWGDNPDDPKGDCCYDTWQKQLDEVNQKYKEADEKAKQLQKQVESAIGMRDKVRNWLDDLTKAGDLSVAICQSLDVFSSQVKNICCTTESTVKAIDILYCMVKDFYVRLDGLKSDYDELITCIKCLNNPDLNGGILSCLSAYAVKLDAAIVTRDKLIELLVKAIKLAYEVHESICSRYGLKRVILEWQWSLACVKKEGEEKKEYKQPQQQQQQQKQEYGGGNQNDDDCGCGDEDCELLPMLSFPLKGSQYFNDLNSEKTDLDNKIDQLNTDLVAANKTKETLQANRDNLIKAIEKVDPKNKCK